MLIDTHWHVDHSDNNANFRSAGATVLAHENARDEPEWLPVVGILENRGQEELIT